MKKKITGINVARALAVFGMIIVNFKLVFGESGRAWVRSFAGVFDGKAAATFVVLAGMGLALMTNKALKDGDIGELKILRKKIAVRALFLFAAGLSYIAIWPADILHYYGVYILAVLLLMRRSGKVALVFALVLIFIYPLLMVFWDYEAGWNFISLEYQDFWTLKGFVRNLLFNGFHPVVPWTAFMLTGYWFGKQELNNEKFVKKACWISLIAFFAIQCFSYGAISYLSGGDKEAAAVLREILGTSPMPPLPVYMLNGIAVSFAVISFSILIARRYKNSKVIDALDKTGQMALTFYVMHVVIGMGLAEAVDFSKMGNYPVEFSVLYALVFCLLCVWFAVVWRKYWNTGPLEWLMKRLTG
ncbi:MAG: DUF418 domain-containing protein [Cytophagales bacterium]|nr:DUF418 domain-containing protein [Cytophagales bacterium]